MAFIRHINSGVQSDSELLEQYRASRDAELLASLYGRYMELVYGVCLRYLEDAEAAKDAVMDIYNELTQKLHRHEVSNFKSWLYSVARNHCLMKLRGATLRTVNIDDERVQSADEMHQDDVQEKESRFVILESCMERLPDEQKRAITLFYMEQQCYNQIVKITGFDWNKVRSLVQNGRRNLKICIEKTRSGSVERTG